MPALVRRAERLAGRTLGWLAEQHGRVAPEHLRGHKGWVGDLLEAALGADAGSRDAPDFEGLGVELKTLPVDASAVPRESTWVCTAVLDGSVSESWEASRVHRKLARVLWIPIVGDGVPASRLVGAPVFWEPSPQDEAVLRRDWEELTEAIRLGHLDRLDARMGEALQLRPKAANRTETTWMLDREGDWVETGPRGFYLRRSFTSALMARSFGAG